MTLVNGVLGGVGGAFATMPSVAVAIAAGVTAVALALIVLIFHY